ncbi:hypothetical protein [Variovorax sp. E3]|uniref:hypothetical protein n=1 Tax=Variovorax sp. E3 TaxID=1914993 RepID=UPI0018DD4E84|nr:hypothetical protein [Variovorax sp. E3]
MRYKTVLLSLSLAMSGTSHTAEVALEDKRETYLDCAATLIQARLFTFDQRLVDRMMPGGNWFIQRAAQQDADSGVPQEIALAKAVQDSAAHSQRLMAEVLSSGSGDITSASFSRLQPCLDYYQSRSRSKP